MLRLRHSLLVLALLAPVTARAQDTGSEFDRPSDKPFPDRDTKAPPKRKAPEPEGADLDPADDPGPGGEKGGADKDDLELPKFDRGKGKADVSLGLMIAHWSAGIFHMKVAQRVHGFGGESFDPQGSGAKELDRAETQVVRAWAGAGIFRLEGTYRFCTYRDDDRVREDFELGRVRFNQNTPISTRLQTWVFDMDARFAPVRVEGFSVEVGPGIRYVHTKFGVRDLINAGIDQHFDLDGVIPCFGTGVSFKIEHLELYARARVGYFEWSARRHRRMFVAVANNNVPGTQAFGPSQLHTTGSRSYRYDVATSEAEAGVKVTFFDDHVGAVVGYRFESVRLHESSRSRRKTLAFSQEGPFAGLVVQY